MIYNSWKPKRAIFNGPKMLKLKKNNEEIKKKEKFVARFILEFVKEFFNLKKKYYYIRAKLFLHIIFLKKGIF